MLKYLRCWARGEWMGRTYIAAACFWLPALSIAGSAWENDPYEQAAAVNEGPLEILEHPPDKPAHHHVNRLTVTAESLTSGWVQMDQCHYDIDPVSDVEIVFTPEKIRDLQVTHTVNIGNTTTGAHSVSVEDVGRGAILCISGETRAIENIGKNYILRNGPFMRRFLDGFYPMHVTLEIRYPPGLLPAERFPASAPGVRYIDLRGKLVLDVWFEGILETRFLFRESGNP